ncbi:class I SAM-dependent methyltransferase [Pedococcus sp. P5_B7]
MTGLEEAIAPSPVAALFDAVADDYDQTGVDFFAPIADGLVAELDPQPGESCVDLGCGRGAVTLGLAERVLPEGSVVGLDVSRGMLAHARELVASRGFDVDLRVGDAADPSLPRGAFDVVASSLVLFFLPDPPAALARWVELLAPGGRIGIATFGDPDPVWDAVDKEFGPWVPPMMKDPRVVGPDSPFTSDAGMEEMLRNAGAVDVRTGGFRLEVRFGDVGGWERFSRSTGQRAVWARMSEDEVAGVVARAGEHLENACDENGSVVVWQDIRYTLGVAP